MTSEREDYPFTQYKVGDVVPHTGIYKCGVSAETMQLEKGEEFPDCEPATDENATWELVEKY